MMRKQEKHVAFNHHPFLGDPHGPGPVPNVRLPRVAVPHVTPVFKRAAAAVVTLEGEGESS